MKENNKIKHFLMISMTVVSVICIAIFTFLGFYMTNRNDKTINQVGSIYMRSMNDRISQHFSTMIDLRITQLDTIAETLPDEGDIEDQSSRIYKDSPELRNALEYNGKIRGFEALAYYYNDRSIEMVYGTQVYSENVDFFHQSMLDGKRNVSVGKDEKGEQCAVIGVPFHVVTEDSRRSIALVGRMSIEMISETLSLELDNSLLFSFVIRMDGTFVIRSAGASSQTYFERAKKYYDKVDGKDSVDQFLAELKSAMEKGEDYSAMFTMNGERRQMYCSSLPSSQWFLVTVLPYGELNETISSQGVEMFIIAITCCILILLILIFIFVRYSRMSHYQLVELNQSKKEAEEANKSKSEFLSNMSHDIRTPMNAIVGMTAIAMANIEDKNRVENCLRKITLSSKHLLGLINDVLDMSKIESGKMTLNVELVSLKEIMESIVSIVQPQIKAKKQKFDIFIYDITSENVICDSVRLNQVLINLVSNAVKFTPEGGKIEISLHEQESPLGDEYVRILLKVKDTGIGMSDEFMNHIFDSFAREDSKRVQKTEGTGLGMAITKYIIDAMGGTIDVKSTQGVGTEFNVTLDFERSDEKEEDMILPDFTMLLVDDDKQLCESTTASLKSIGVRADWTLDGESAIEIVRQHHQKHNDYHIILLDFKLPGIDGINTARELRKQLGKDVPILLISAYDWSDFEDEAREAGINGFISKPLFKSTLYYGLKPFIDVTNTPIENINNNKVDYSGKRILLAEDNDLNWEIAYELLSVLGLEIERAENGEVCANMFASSPIGYYDVILMDIRMPVKDGYEATDLIRSMDRSDKVIPIIAMTADAFSEDIQRCLDHGMNAHIAKPIDIKELTRILGKYFD